jgi:hypothetical protein
VDVRNVHRDGSTAGTYLALRAYWAPPLAANPRLAE